MPDIQLRVLIGQYAQAYYLKEVMKNTLTETVQSFKEYCPDIIPLPHPSPRNRFWLFKNPWFEKEVIPYLKIRVQEILRD